MAGAKLFQCCVAVLLLFVLANGLERCRVAYDKVGCFRDNIYDRTLPDLLVTDRDVTDKKKYGKAFNWNDFEGSVRSLLCRCAAKAKASGYKYIGIQFFAECWGGYDKRYAINGPSKQCMQSYATFGKEVCNYKVSSDCAGLGYTNFVYSLLECHERIDIAILLDVSSSVKETGLESAKKIIKELIDLLPLTKRGAHLSLVTFASTANLIFDFKSVFNKGGQEMNLKALIDNIQSVGGSTWPDTAFKVADKQLFTYSGGVRPDRPRFLITFTDGSLHQHSVIAPSLRNLKLHKGVQLMSVGIGTDINSAEVQNLAHSKDGNVFDGNQDDVARKLFNRITKLADEECGEPSFTHN